MQGDKLVIVRAPNTADSFRTGVKMLKSVDPRSDASFHTYRLFEAQCTDDSSKQPSFLIIYLEAYLDDLEIWLRYWRIVINVGKCAVVLAFLHSWGFLEKTFQWTGKVIYLRVALNRKLTWAIHIYRVRIKVSQGLWILSRLPNKRTRFSIWDAFTRYRQLNGPWWTMLSHVGDMLPEGTWGTLNSCNPIDCILLLALLGTLAFYSCMRIWKFLYRWTH